MVNRRVFASAAAIAIFLALGVVGDGHQEILEYSARVVAELTDIEGVPLEIVLYERVIPMTPEELVEGHTVFATMNIELIPHKVAKEVNVAGLVECRYDIIGVQVPSLAIERIYAECNVGGSIWLSDPDSAQPTSRHDLEPTGREYLVDPPDGGEPSLVVEYAYWSPRTDEDGLERYERVYCWETFVRPVATNPRTDKPFNFVARVDLDRMEEMGTNRVSVSASDAFFTLGR